MLDEPALHSAPVFFARQLRPDQALALISKRYRVEQIPGT